MIIVNFLKAFFTLPTMKTWFDVVGQVTYRVGIIVFTFIIVMAVRNILKGQYSLVNPIIMMFFTVYVEMMFFSIVFQKEIREIDDVILLLVDGAIAFVVGMILRGITMKKNARREVQKAER